MLKERRNGALPMGWLAELFEKADLEGSYRALDGQQGFYAEAWRGRIRSLQLRLDESGNHLQAAYTMAEALGDTIENLALRFKLETWLFEHALLETPADSSQPMPLSFWEPALSERTLTTHPEAREVIDGRRYMEGILRLHAGDRFMAAAVFTELIRSGQDAFRHPFYYLGLAASLHDGKLGEESMQALAQAGEAVRAGSAALTQAHGAAALASMYRYVGKEKESGVWLRFLDGTSCPDATKAAFRKRGELLEGRCRNEGRLLVF